MNCAFGLVMVELQKFFSCKQVVHSSLHLQCPIRELFFFFVVVVLSSFLNAVFIETPKVTKTQSSIYFEEFHNVESIYFSNFVHINCTYWLLLPLIPTFLSCSGWFTLFCVPQRLTWAIFVIRDLELCIGACWPQQWEHS